MMEFKQGYQDGLNVNKYDTNSMIDIDPKDKICSNCKRWLGKHRFDLNGLCRHWWVPMPFNNNCSSIYGSDKFKKRK